MEYLKWGRNLGAGLGGFCTLAGAATDFRNPNVNNARASYRTGVGLVATGVGVANPLAGLLIQLGGKGLEYSYDNVFVPIGSEFIEGFAGMGNGLQSGTWYPNY